MGRRKAARPVEPGELINREWLKSVGIYPCELTQRAGELPHEYGVRIRGGSDMGDKRDSNADKPGDEIAELIIAFEPDGSVHAFIETYEEGTNKTLAVIELGRRETRAEVLELCRGLMAWAIRYDAV